MHKNFDFVLLVFYPFARRPLVLPLYETCAHFVINVKREASAGEKQELGWGLVRELEHRLGQFIHRDLGPTSLYSHRQVRLTRVLHVRKMAASVSNDWRRAERASQRECHEARPSHSSETSVSPSGILLRGVSDFQSGAASVRGLRSWCQSRFRAHFGSLCGAWSWPRWSGQDSTTLQRRCEARLSCRWPRSWAAPHSCLPRSRGCWREAQTPCTWRHAVSWPEASPQLPAVRW